MTGDTGGKRLWNETAGYFIHHIHSISQSGTVNQGPHFDSTEVRGGELGHWEMANGHGVAVPAQPKSVLGVGVSVKWIINKWIQNIPACPC